MSTSRAVCAHPLFAAALGLMLVACVTLTDNGQAPPFGNAATAPCSPWLPEGFGPHWKPPRAPTHACSEEQIQAYYDACRGGMATPSTCETFTLTIENTTCIQCLVTTASRATFGAIIRWSDGSVSANVGGCIAVTEGDLSDSGCGARVLAKDECEDSACASCARDNEQHQAAFDRCRANSEATVCNTYAVAAECAERHPEDDRCFFGDDFRSNFLGVGAFFCANSDAGASHEGGAGDATVD
jgi:hypothetical protein